MRFNFFGDGTMRKVVSTILAASMLTTVAFAGEMHIVTEGESLYSVSEKYGVEIDALAAANDMDSKEMLQLGQELVIPEAGVEAVADEVEEGEEDVLVAELSVPMYETAAEESTIANDDGLLSMSFRDADIRDIFSIIALEMGKTIIYMGDSVNVTFTLSDVTPTEALDLASSLAGVSYLIEGDTLIVGYSGTLSSSFYDKMYITKFSLRYITADMLQSQLGTMGLDVKIMNADANKKAIWVQGFPKELAKISQVINVLDRNENLMLGASAVSDNFQMITTTNITASEFSALLGQLSLPTGILVSTNPYSLYMYASYEDFDSINKIKAIVDVEGNYSTESGTSAFELYQLTNISASSANTILSQIDSLQIVTSDVEPMTLWMRGPATAITQAYSVLEELDTTINNKVNTINVYSLRNITASEMEAKLGAMGISDVLIYTFTMPQFSRSIMIGTSPDNANNISKIITKLDASSASITLPVDSAEGNGATANLGARRTLIAEMSGIPVSSFKISGNVSKDRETTRYVLYLTASPEEIQRVRDIVAEIDGV